MDDRRTARDFWLLWSGVVTSNLGDGIRQTALPLLAVTITTDPLAVSAVTAATMMPWLFSLIGGAVVDRTDRRRLVIAGQLIRGAAVAGLGVLVLADSVGLVVLYLVAIVVGTGEVVVDSALQAAIPQVADDLETANSRIASGQIVAGDIIGGPIGGALFLLSTSLPFLIDAATFLVGAWLISLVARPLQTAGDGPRPTTIVEDIREGLRFLWGTPILRGMTAAITLSNIAVASLTSLLVLLVTEAGGGEVSFGVIVGIGAVGGVLGAMSAGRVLAVFGRRISLILPFGLIAASLLVVGVADSVIAVGVGEFFVIYSAALSNVSVQSTRQRVTPDRLLGRVVAGMRFFGFGGAPLGALGGGLVARSISLQPTMLIAAAISFGSVIAITLASSDRNTEPQPST